MIKMQEAIDYSPTYHCNNVIMSAMVSQISDVSIVYSTVWFRTQIKENKLRAIGLCEGNPPVTSGSPHKGPVTQKNFRFDDVIMRKENCAMTKSHNDSQTRRSMDSPHKGPVIIEAFRCHTMTSSFAQAVGWIGTGNTSVIEKSRKLGDVMTWECCPHYRSSVRQKGLESETFLYRFFLCCCITRCWTKCRRVDDLRGLNAHVASLKCRSRRVIARVR